MAKKVISTKEEMSGRPEKKKFLQFGVLTRLEPMTAPIQHHT